MPRADFPSSMDITVPGKFVAGQVLLFIQRQADTCACMDFGPKFTLVREGTLLADIAARAKDARPVLKQWGAYLKAGLSKPSSTRPLRSLPARLRSRHHRGHRLSRSRPRFAPPTLVAWILHCAARAAQKPAKTSAGCSAGTCRRAAGIAPWIGCAAGCSPRGRPKRRGMRIATGKKQIEKSKGVRGGKMGGAFRVIIRGLSVIVQNSAKYSAVHNRGGRVGNGAVLPAWGFMFISAKAKADLAEIALNWILRK